MQLSGLRGNEGHRGLQLVEKLATPLNRKSVSKEAMSVLIEIRLALNSAVNLLPLRSASLTH